MPFRAVVARSVASYWRDSTFGLAELVFDTHPAEGQPIPILQISQASGRVPVIDAAKNDSPSLVTGADVVVVWIYPPPCDGGAAGNGALFDRNGYYSFYCHEIGHTLGMQHPYGPGGVYDDPYCVMGRGQTRPVSPDPAFASLPPADTPGFWDAPCRPSAANLFTHWEGDLLQNNMVEAGSWGQPFEVELVALSEASLGDKVLTTVDIGNDFDRNPRRTWPQNGSYLIEYRTASGWDGGVQPAIVIHSRDVRPFPIVVKRDFFGHPHGRFGEVRPVYFEGTIPRPFDSVYVSPNGRLAVEVLDISADSRTGKLRFGLPNQMTYQADLHLMSRVLLGDQVLETGTKTITPEQDPLLCQEGTYAYTRFDQAEEVTVELHLSGFPIGTANWAVAWAPYDSTPISQGDTTFEFRSMFHKSAPEYLDVSLHGDVLVMRSRLAVPDVNGKLWRKVSNEVDISVTVEQTQPSGFMLGRRADLTVWLATERTDLDDHYKQDVDFCYFLRTFRGIDKATDQPPWIDPSDPFWQRKLGDELVELGRLPKEILSELGGARSDLAHDIESDSELF